MSVETMVACATCGGPTIATGVPAELEKWMALVRPVCALCVAVADAEAEQRDAAEMAARVAELHARRLRRVGVPPHLVGYGFGNIDRPDGLGAALELARAWAAGEVQGFGMIGPVGTGKTRVGVAAANEACWRAQAHWYSAPVLIARMTARFDTPERDDAMRAITGSAPLVIDDLDKSPATEHAAQTLFTAIDSHADGGGQLLVTTNLQGPELARRWPQPFGESIVDRLKPLEWTRVGGASKRWEAKA